MMMNKCLLLLLFSIFSYSWKVGDSPYRDLNKNGKKDIYEDKLQPIDKRVSDLISQMTIEEKAGQMFIQGTGINPDGSIGKKEGMKLEGPAAMAPTPDVLIRDKHLSHFNFWATPPTRELAMGVNAIQKAAEDSRLGIPVTIYSDPRHYFSSNIFTTSANGMSQWPEQLGFAAIGDPLLMQTFGDIARQEYLAVGIRGALHPMADLATEPRWPRCNGTFGEDANLSAKMIKPYIIGFQGGNSITNKSVACMTKHFSGGGPQKEGLDSHFDFQKGQVYPGNNFNYHLKPFEAAFAAHTAAIMPYYGVPTGQTSENVGFGYNKDIITGLLRNKYKFDGVVCTDWGLVTDVHMGPTTWVARAWGVENLSPEERVLKIIDAGCDQLGGESCPELIVNLVKSGKLSEDRINQSMKRILKQKFQLGLFDNPYVDVEHAVKTVGKAEWKALGEKTQRRSLTLLKNEKHALPLTAKKYKIFIKNIKKEVAEQYGTVVAAPEEADFAIVRANTPWKAVESPVFLAKMFHHGDLDFKGKDKEELLDICKKVPTIFDIYIDRPAVFPEINAAARAVLADYGASDAAVLDVIFGKAKCEGKLPFELPSSMEAVRNQKEDLPHDSEKPLYAFGFGLSMAK
jgi:beta-glucosidase